MKEVLGVDVSTWQGEMNWNTAAAAGARFAFIRICSTDSVTGRPYEDWQFPRNAVQAPDYLLAGGYGYFRPNFDPLVQADFLCERASTWDRNLPIVADIETNGGLPPRSTQIQGAVRAYLERIEQNTGEMPIIYTRGSWWNLNLGNPDWASAYDLWCARYNPLLDGPWSDGYYRPEPWNAWHFWQFSADGNGRGAEFGAQSDSIDLNWWYSSYDDLLEYAGLTPTPPTGHTHTAGEWGWRFVEQNEERSVANQNLLDIHEERLGKLEGNQGGGFVPSTHVIQLPLLNGNLERPDLGDLPEIIQEIHHYAPDRVALTSYIKAGSDADPLGDPYWAFWLPNAWAPASEFVAERGAAWYKDNRDSNFARYAEGQCHIIHLGDDNYSHAVVCEFTRHVNGNDKPGWSGPRLSGTWPGRLRANDEIWFNIDYRKSV
jgi:GH25 family lysozyme M1 (1,4-beta-N-acetylmuramidase)